MAAASGLSQTTWADLRPRGGPGGPLTWAALPRAWPVSQTMNHCPRMGGRMRMSHARPEPARHRRPAGRHRAWGQPVDLAAAAGAGRGEYRRSARDGAAAFGWSGEHLHYFTVHGARYGICFDGGPVFRDDAHRVRLASLGAARERAVHLHLQLLRRLAAGPARGTDHRRPQCPGVSAVHRRSPRRTAGGLGRAVGLPAADPAVSGG